MASVCAMEETDTETMPSELAPFTALHANDVRLEHQALPEQQQLSGTVTTATRELATFGSVEIGIWEISEGVSRDVEVDEVFIVTSGRGTVVVPDGEDVTEIRLEPGVICRLEAGAHTEWHVTERLRKIYIAGSPVT